MDVASILRVAFSPFTRRNDVAKAEHITLGWVLVLNACAARAVLVSQKQSLGTDSQIIRRIFSATSVRGNVDV